MDFHNHFSPQKYVSYQRFQKIPSSSKKIIGEVLKAFELTKVLTF
jgi:hypothetical protein